LKASDLAATALSTAISFVVGLLVIRFLLSYLNKGSFAPFVWWRILVGIGIISALASGLIAA
jgi:undecaprenyl-diphosphatase